MREVYKGDRNSSHHHFSFSKDNKVRRLGRVGRGE